MSLKLQAVKNVAATWLGLLVHAIVGFFLSPFILHRLGDAAFSLWILVFALTGYFGLLDMGVRSSIVKHTAGFLAADDKEQLARYISTSLAFYGMVAILVLLASIAGFFCLPLLFKIPVTLLGPARILILISGASVALTLPLGAFAGVLEGLQKFAWLQFSNIGITVVRAVLIVAVLENGGGLLAVGIITVGMNLLSYLIFTGMAFCILPLRLRWQYVEIRAFRKMMAYGLFASAILVAERLRFQSDALVIGAFLSTTAITMFSIAARLVEYSSYAVKSMTQIVTPMTSKFQATGDLVRLRKTFEAGNRACALITFPLCLILVILGKPIIESWVGIKYVAAYSVLLLLIVPRTLYLAQSTSVKILLGMGRHRALASILLLEGATNALLSLMLVRRFGIVGVAWGTAIPLLCTSLLFLPEHLCRVLDVPVGTFLLRAYRLPLLLCMPLAGTLWFANYEFPAHTYAGVMLQIACGGVVYSAGFAWAMFNGNLRSVRSWPSFAHMLETK
jgi:O-antigen/teichoic acid export membrane protein